MISWISSWAQGIIISVIIGTIIEIILPEGNSKKYIKTVIGLFILFTIVTPVINKFTNKSFNIESFTNVDNYSQTKEVISMNLEEKNNFNIKQMYETNLKIDIKNKIKSKGFKTKDIILKISDDGEYRIENIEITILEEIKEKEEKNNKSNVIGIVDTIDRISINISKSTTKEEKKYQISSKDSNNLKEYLSTIYDINEKSIIIY